MIKDAIHTPIREIVFDTETTGFDPASGDRLVEIGLVEMVGRVETGRSWHAYYNPKRSMPPQAEAVHGLSEKFLADKPLFADLVGELLDFIGDSVLIAHNAQFDMAFLDCELRLCGKPPLGIERSIDTLAIARIRHPGAKHTLDALCTRYGVDRSHRVKHGALLDAQLLAQVYIELTGGRQIGLDLSSEISCPSERSLLADVVTPIATRPLRPARLHAPTPSELERHAVFITRLTDALWQSAGTSTE